MLTILLALPLLYGALCGAAWLYQDRMLFPAPPAREALPPGGERLTLRTADGVQLVGLHLAAKTPDAKAPVVLGFGGNGWNADDSAGTLGGLYPGADIVAFHYRGYKPSGGRPSSTALEADSLLVHDFVARRFAGRRIVAVGFSIGSGVAAYVAAHRPLAGVILVTPFDSLTKVAAGQLPWLPVRVLFRNPMEPAAALRSTHVPTAIIAAERDTIVPPARTEALRRAIPNLVLDRTIPGVGHNEIYWSSEFRAAMHEAMARMDGR